MDDERVVGAELERLAANDPLAPIDPHAMLTRGRRSRRTRRLLGGGGAIAAVAVVALGATLLPGPAASDPAPEVAGETSADFSAVPGVPRGEAGTGVELSIAEANRRCALRYPEVKRPLRPNPRWWAGRIALFDLKRGDQAAVCMVPGGDKPSAALVAAARRDPVPTTPAGLLRNCSVGFWTDLTKWRVLASDVDPGRASSVLAMSPSGRSTVKCTAVPEEPHREAGVHLNSTIVRGPVKQLSFQEAFRSGMSGSCSGGKCTQLYSSAGRLSSDIVRVTFEQVGTTGTLRHEVPVRDSWYAVAWLNTMPSGLGLKIQAHHKDGSVEVLSS
ncbi:hypothetical protein ACFCV3_06390 [Kribbella sp. NPDC056345]|uniref:hypothetical protein n=1 Tax=Kribbella sp. NPDC056345 TaxID=3345789 RepID=UPI0035D7B94E